ncbi:MAG: HD domain-containing protein [Gemmatimonadota bacterium]|nr:HD domain-containing protein [Gemmatimonadota bacterium]
MTTIALRPATDLSPLQSFDDAIAASRALEKNGHWAEARTTYEGLLVDESLSPLARSSLLRWIGRAHAQEGNPNVGITALEQAVEVARVAADSGAEAHALNGLAIIEQTVGNIDRSEELYALARSRAADAGDEMLLAMLDQNLGTAANIRGNLELALQLYESSKTRFKALGLSSYEAHVLNNVGMVCTDLGQWDDAEHAYDAACDACASGDETGLLRRIEVNQAELWIARKEINKARTRCERLLADARNEGGISAPWLGEVYKHYGVVCREQKQLDRADEWFAKAAAVASSSRDLLLSAETAREQAELYWMQSRNTDTLSALNSAHVWFSQLRAERDLDSVARRNGRLEERFLDVVRKWGESIECKDIYTQGHCVRVANVACALAGLAGFDAKTMFWFRIGALLHDVGKLIVPVEVLNKPGRLDKDEWRIMKRHPEAGVELLAGIEFPWDIRPMVRNHHERWDGCGYPDRLEGASIPLSARILCIADVYDALTTTRSYRSGFDHAHAVEIMVENNATGHFDPEMFDLFLQWAHHQPTAV